jgi:ketosteroid isomerase-like protein
MSWPRSLFELPRTLLGFHVWIAKNPPRSRGDVEDRLHVLEIDAAARRVLYRYAYCYDAGDIDGLMDIYTDDCVLVNRRGTFVGRDAIRSTYDLQIAERHVAFHHLANIDVRPAARRDEAWATAYIHNLAVRDGNAGGTMASAVFHLRREPDAWRVCEIRIAISNQHGFVPPAPRLPHGQLVSPTRPESVADLIDDLE